MATDIYADLLVNLLVAEWGYTEEEAANLVQAYPAIVAQGWAGGGQTLRGAAMAIDHLHRSKQE